MRAALKQWLAEGGLLWLQLVILAVAHVPAALGLELSFLKRTGLWRLRESPEVSVALAAFTVAMLAALWFIRPERRVPRLALAGVLFAVGIVGGLAFSPALILTFAWTARSIAQPQKERSSGGATSPPAPGPWSPG